LISADGFTGLADGAASALVALLLLLLLWLPIS